MFLDPEPKRQESMSPKPRRPKSNSPFFGANAPFDSSRHRRDTSKRQPLHERTASENNRQLPSPQKRLQQGSPGKGQQYRSPDKPTIRLVTTRPRLDSPTQSPSPPTSAHGSNQPKSGFDHEYLQTAKEIRVQRFDRAQPRLSTSDDARAPATPEKAVLKQGSESSSQDSDVHGVSGHVVSANEAQSDQRPSSITLLSHPTATDHDGLKTSHRRQHSSSGRDSTSSSLEPHEARDSTVEQSSSSRSERFSAGTTLRGTPTPIEQEFRERLDTDDDIAKQLTRPISVLQPLTESSPERRTVRAVPPSLPSTSSSNESNLVRPHTAPSTLELPPPIPRKSSKRRASSTSSVIAPLTIRKRPSSSAVQSYASRDSFAVSDCTTDRPSSALVFVYEPGSSRPTSARPGSSRPGSSRPSSRGQVLRFSDSLESIQSRLQGSSSLRPHSSHSYTNRSSRTSRPSSSGDTLPPLQNPKRIRHKAGHRSLNTAARPPSRGKMDGDSYDTLPYPRQAFSSHLSTIASESPQQSRSTSRQLSHFSLGSGVLTGDDSSSVLPSASPPRRRRASVPIESMVSGGSPTRGTSSEDEPGDMTLGIYREESAKPSPLFKQSSLGLLGEDRRYDGPMPPMPPIPADKDGDENWDSVSELQSPSLRPKRSGYSLRARSNSTPSRSNSHSRRVSQISYVESERWSNATSIFPVWAKHFYSGTAVLASASKTSLGLQGQSRPGTGKRRHGRNESQWTERSITSRLGTGYSELGTSSPTGSYFLPSIFRPRTRLRNAERNSRASRARRSKRSRPSDEDPNRPDSLAIFSNPLPTPEGDVLPSGQPKWGNLAETSTTSLPIGAPRPLQRKYSKQRQWDGMQFPRPMTKDRFSDMSLGVDSPHLVPTKRTARRLSAWRAPSFVEGIDTLFQSRGNRQILLFAVGFVCPLAWLLAALLPLPAKPMTMQDAEQARSEGNASAEDIEATMVKHEAGDAEQRWREEKAWMKARWWRQLNRIMSVVGLLVIGAVVALAIVATRA